jgi:Na/Pi-cotransporter
VKLYPLLSALGGLGLFLFSLRILTRVLQRNLSRRLRGAFSRAFGHPLQCLLGGLLATAMVQASSITVMSSMSMVGSTLITLEQGYFMMLGATLGTTLKAWVVSLDALALGPVLVGLGSLAMLVVQRTTWREVFEGIMSVGLALWGMWLVGKGLTPLLQETAFQEVLARYPGVNLVEQSICVLIGALITGCVQSSSTIVNLCIVMVAAQKLDFTQAACLILGANIGTTFGPLLASLEYGTQMRRLALAHTLVKTLGVLITLFFFPQFVGFWSSLVPAGYASFQLAAIHTGFNLINVIWWSIFSGLIMRLVTALAPSHQELPGLALAPVVRRMLTRSPERSREEARRQLQQLLACVKLLLDQGVALWVGERNQETRLENRLLEQREFQGLKESTYELLVQASRGQGEDLRALLARLADMEELYFQAVRLRECLELGLLRESVQLPDGLKCLASDYQRCVDELWLRILFPNEDKPLSLEPVALACQLEDAFFAALRQPEALTSLQASWCFEVVSNLRSVLVHLGSMARER